MVTKRSLHRIHHRCSLIFFVSCFVTTDVPCSCFLHQYCKASPGPLGVHNGCLFCVLFPECGLFFCPCLCVFFSFYWKRKRFCFVCVLGYSPTSLPVFMLYFYVLFVFIIYQYQSGGLTVLDVFFVCRNGKKNKGQKTNNFL